MKSSGDKFTELPIGTTLSLFDGEEMLRLSDMGKAPSAPCLTHHLGQAKERRDAGIENLQQWILDPISAFSRWVSGSSINNGKPFTLDSQKVYASMWGKYVRFCSLHNECPARSNEHLVLQFLDSLIQERISQASIKGHTQFVRSRDRGGVARHSRRYLSLLSRIFEFLLVVEVRTPEMGDPAKIILRNSEPEPERPIADALKPINERRFKAKLVQLQDAEPDPSKWKEMRDAAICQLIVGSGLTSRQVRELNASEVLQGLDDDVPWIYPEPARQNQTMVNKVPLTTAAQKSLKSWLDLRRQRIAGDVLFPATLAGTRMSSAALYRSVCASINDLAIKDSRVSSTHLGPRTLRATFATRQIRSGKPVSDVQKWMGLLKMSSTLIYEKAAQDKSNHPPED